jgi:collagenase-like PrtC family protease
MKILSPLDSFEEVEGLARAGAGEFFCGVLEDTWYEKYPVISINRRPAGKGHFRRFEDLKEAVRRAHGHGIPVYFTVNEHYYVQAQYDLIRRYLDGAVDAGIDAFILTDFGLLQFIKEHGYPPALHISTGGTVFNWRSVAFFKELGAGNITFPRHLSITEIGDIAAKMPTIETTVFILNSRCINIDGFCTFQHGLARKEVTPMFKNACMLPFEVQMCSDRSLPFMRQACMIERQRIWERVHVDDHPCGACALYEFKNIGIGSLKIVGRGNPLDRKLRDVQFLKRLLAGLAEQPAQAQFREAARALYTNTYRRQCREHMCYYPEVLDPEQECP